MSKPKLNDPDVEQTTTIPIIETQCTSCSKYPLKNFKINFEELEILKVFEEWGYHITTNDKYLVIFDSEKQFIIDKEQKQYFVSNWNNEHDRYKITFKEHYWLNKLFEIWRWFDA